MSAPNFTLMENFDLWIMGNADACLYYIGDEDEEGNKIEEYSDADVAFAWDLFNDDEDEYSLISAVDTLNDKLYFFEVSIVNGYYEGVQLLAESLYYTIEDYADEYGISLEKGKEIVEEEMRMIREFLAESGNYGFRKLICDGIFSNGEAIYHYA